MIFAVFVTSHRFFHYTRRGSNAAQFVFGRLGASRWYFTGVESRGVGCHLPEIANELDFGHFGHYSGNYRWCAHVAGQGGSKGR